MPNKPKQNSTGFNFLKNGLFVAVKVSKIVLYSILFEEE